MSRPSDSEEGASSLWERVVGLGSRSAQKSYYPQLQRQVDELKRAEEALRESEAKYREIFNATNEAIFIHDAETGSLLEFNKRVLELYGVQADELRAAPADEFMANVPPYTLADAQQWLRRAVEEGPQVFEWRCRRKGGELFWGEVALKTIHVGGMSRVLAVVRDITERKRAVEEAARREESFQRSQRMEAMGRLAGSIAHDFNNILQGIQGYASLSLAMLAPGNPVHRYLQEVSRAASTATDLTRQLLTFSRGETTRRRHVILNEVVRKFTALLRRLLGENVHLVEDLDGTPTTVQCDPGQLEQVVMNLCVNARDAMPGGGVIRVTTRTETAGRLACQEHGCAEGERFAVLSVSDTGAGIPPEHLERIFEPFFSTKEAGKGTGLGLATVYGTVKAHGGFVHVESSVGKGTVFRVYLPVTSQAAESLQGPTHEALHAGAGQTILLAEDDELVRSVICEVLTRAGYRVQVARDGREAIRFVQESRDRMDLAILDAVMPEATGEEVCAVIRRQGWRIPIVIASGYSEGIPGGVLPEGVVTMAKPFLPHALLARVQELLASREATVE